MYTQLSESNPNELLEYCRSCGLTQQNSDLNGFTVSKLCLTNSSDTNISNVVTPHAKYDPTLPSAPADIPCPNAACASNAKDDTKKPRNIKYSRFNNAQMLYVYICCECDHIWSYSKK